MSEIQSLSTIKGLLKFAVAREGVIGKIGKATMPCSHVWILTIVGVVEHLKTTRRRSHTRMTRMFEGLRTWNPYFGCQYRCYKGGCWANRRLAHRLGKMLNCQLCYDFMPHYHRERLNRVPSDPKIFVCAHGDLFGYWVSSHFIHTVLEVCRSKPKETWFFETKNPERYLEFVDCFPDNTLLSTTIETNREYALAIRGYAPLPVERFQAMEKVTGRFPIHVSIEPIMDFDMADLVEWMQRLRPSKVAVGYDSLNNHLPEPPKEKTFALIEKLAEFTDVEKKQLE